MKIAHSHRHISESEYQPCIAVQTHDASFLPPENTTGDTDSLLFLKIVLQRPVHQLDIVRHGFIQIDKFFHLTVRDYRRTVGVIVRHQILAGKHGRQNTFQLDPGAHTNSQPLPSIPFSSVNVFSFWMEPVAKASFTIRAESRRTVYSSLV